MDVRLKHSFTCMVAGPSCVGKTEFVKKLLYNANYMIDKPPHKIVWFYSEYQPSYVEMMKSIPNIEFHENLPSEFKSFTSKERPTLFVIDDLMDVVCDDKRVAALFTKNCHLDNVSLIYISQNVFQCGKQSRTISLNTQYYCLFRNNRDRLQINCLGRQMYPGRVKFFQEAYDDATKLKWGYLFIDLKPDTPDELRLRTNIFPGERPIVYVSKV